MRLWNDRALLAGLAVRLALIVLATPLAHLGAIAGWRGGFVPFAVSAFDGLPQQWLASGTGALGWFVGAPTLALALALVVLAADIGVMLLLARSGPAERRDEVARLYWLSPLVIWLNYANGTLAAVTAVLLVASFIGLSRRRYALAGLGFGLACGAQPALVVLVAPVVVLFAAGLARLRRGARDLVLSMVAAIAVLVVLPGLLWPMLRGELLRGWVTEPFSLVLPLGGATVIAVLPLLLAALLYGMWRARLVDCEMLWTFVTLALLAAVACGGASAGTLLLAAMFLSHHAAYAERSGRAGLLALSGLLLVQVALQLPGPVIARVSDGAPLAARLGEWGALALVALPTVVAITAGVLAAQVVVRGITRYHTYLVTRRPIAIGIAGDSGVGKDTLSNAVAALFSPPTVATVSGDDYHNWDRNKPMWRALTHLNPRANDLALFGRHVSLLIDRRWVRARHYDHSVGRMTKPLQIHPGELVIASGLHALASPALNTLYDLRVYLDMDEALRRQFKIRRDVGERGQPLERVIASMERRQNDAVAFIHPQKDVADIVFRLMPRRPDLLETATGIVPTRLVVDAVPGIGFDPVARTLVAIAGIHAVELPLDGGRARLIVEGEPAPADIAAAARRLNARPEELMRDVPAWEGGATGVMQLVMLHLIEQVRYRRSVNA